MGLPDVTAQKRQARVQTSPRIMKVAVRRFQQSKMFGQRASSHTVCRRLPLTICLSSLKFSPSVTRMRIHEGMGAGVKRGAGAHSWMLAAVHSSRRFLIVLRNWPAIIPSMIR